MNNEKKIWFMRQAGRYLHEYRKVRKNAGSFMNLCLTPEYACEVTLQPIRKFDFSHAIIFSDILTIPYALGYDVKIGIDHNGNNDLLEKIYKYDDIFALDNYDSSKLENVLKAITLTRKNLANNKQLIGFCGAPWTLAIYMIQGRSAIHNQEIHLFAYKYPEAFQHLIDHLTKQIMDYLSKQIEAGCDTVQLFDSWAAMLTEEEFEKYILIPHMKIFHYLKEKHPNVTIIGFPRGIGEKTKIYAQNSGCDVVGCDTSLSIETMAQLQKICGIQGNLDPLLLLNGGPLLKERVKKLKTLYESGDYIFNLGHGIDRYTPVAHVKKVMEWVGVDE